MEYLVFFVIPLVILVVRLESIATAWQNGKVKVAEQQTLQELSRERQEEHKLERAKLDTNKQSA